MNAPRRPPRPTAPARPALLILAILAAPAGRTGLADEQGSAGGGPAFRPPSREELERVPWRRNAVLDPLDLARAEETGRDGAGNPGETGGAPAAGRVPLEERRAAEALARLPASDGAVDPGATIVLHLPAEPRTLAPLLAGSAYEGTVENVLFATPFTIDRGLAPLADADVVEEWWTSQDGRMDRVVLRGGLTWSDRAPFGARDIECAWRAALDPRVGSPSRSHAEGLLAVKAYDDRTVVYVHREALATNVRDLDLPVAPAHLLEPALAPGGDLAAALGKLAREPVTNGPYRLASWRPGEEIVCERRPEWSGRPGKPLGSRPFARAIRFRVIPDRAAALLAFRRGDLDALELTAEAWAQVAADPSFRERAVRVVGDEWSTVSIAWNARAEGGAPFFRDRRVREALSLAIPREEILERVCGGLYLAAAGPFPPGSPMADPGLRAPRRDLPGASRLLREAGFADADGDGVLEREEGGRRTPLEFTLTVPAGNAVYRRIASLLERDLTRVGARCRTREMEFASFTGLLARGRFQAAVLGWGSGADPDTARNLWTTDAIERGRNLVGYSSARVDDLFERGRRELDPGRRMEIYREIDRTIAADAPYAFLYVRSSLYAVSRGLHGFRTSPRGPFGFSPGALALWKPKG